MLVSDPSTVKPDDVLLASQDVRFPNAPAMLPILLPSCAMILFYCSQAHGLLSCELCGFRRCPPARRHKWAVALPSWVLEWGGSHALRSLADGEVQRRRLRTAAAMAWGAGP